MTDGQVVFAIVAGAAMISIPLGLWFSDRYLRTNDQAAAVDPIYETMKRSDRPEHPAWVTALARIATSLEHMQRVNAVGEFAVLPVCQKCGVGNNKITTDYVNGKCGANYNNCVFAVTLWSPRGLLFPDGEPSTEHVHRGCSGCGFWWVERPLDFVDRGNDRG